MLKKLKNYQIMDLMEGFTRIAQIEFKSNKRFNYSVILNEEELAPKKKALMSIAQPSDGYAEYESKRNEIIIEYAQMDAEGNMVIKDNQMVVLKDDKKDVAKKEIEELMKEYEDILEDRTKDIEDYNDILKEEVEVEIHTVSIDDIPDEIGNNIFLMKLLVPMIG